MIREWLTEYNPANQDEAEQAMREIMQEIALAGLYREGFFEKAAFLGGTCLRIFHGLDRFSEDLDFSLLEPDDNFSFQPYMTSISREFLALGIEVDIQVKKKSKVSNINSAFLKADTSWQEIILKGIIPQERPTGFRASIKIKIEVDKKPTPGFETEEKLLLRPFSFYAKCFVLPDLFAGKMHALLFRKWGTRVKGRDWFDMEWYIRKGVKLNLAHLALRSFDTGDWPSKKMSVKDFQKLLAARVNTVSIDRVRDDIEPFIADPGKIAIWSKQYFADLIGKIR